MNGHLGRLQFAVLQNVPCGPLVTLYKPFTRAAISFRYIYKSKIATSQVYTHTQLQCLMLSCSRRFYQFTAFLAGRKLLSFCILRGLPQRVSGLPSMTPWWGTHPQCRRHGFDPWVRRIPWRRRRQPTPGSLPGDFRGQRHLGGRSP